jgi:hypothetical protein
VGVTSENGSSQQNIREKMGQCKTNILNSILWRDEVKKGTRWTTYITAEHITYGSEIWVLNK